MVTAQLISASVTPVVLVSACALVTLALYNRLGAILARIRAFHQQKVELLKNLHEFVGVDGQILLNMLDSQIVGVTAKARMIQKGLYCLLAAMAAFLACALCAGATVFHEWTGILAVGTGVVGLTLFLVGLGWAMRELTLSLSPLEEESAYLDILTAHHLARLQGGKKLKVAESA